MNQVTIKKDLNQAQISKFVKEVRQTCKTDSNRILLNNIIRGINIFGEKIIHSQKTLADYKIHRTTANKASQRMAVRGIITKKFRLWLTSITKINPMFYNMEVREQLSDILPMLKWTPNQIKRLHIFAVMNPNYDFSSIAKVSKATLLNTGVFKKHQRLTNVNTTLSLVSKLTNVSGVLLGGVEERRGETNKGSPLETLQHYTQNIFDRSESKPDKPIFRKKEPICPNCKNSLQNILLVTTNSNNFQNMEMTLSCIVCPNWTNKPNPLPTS